MTTIKTGDAIVGTVSMEETRDNLGEVNVKAITIDMSFGLLKEHEWDDEKYFNESIKLKQDVIDYIEAYSLRKDKCINIEISNKLTFGEAMALAEKGYCLTCDGLRSKYVALVKKNGHTTLGVYDYDINIEVVSLFQHAGLEFYLSQKWYVTTVSKRNNHLSEHIFK